MVKCPYCEAELDLNLSIRPVTIDQNFKNGVLEAMQFFFEVQSEITPFGGFVKSFMKMGLRFIDRYLERIGALPTVLISCKNCDKVISGSLFHSSDFSGGVGGGSGK
ncbi:MAG: hypothetical protein JW891_08235 [Candidatus Lokiarchaeota archaeon]|nr:hypothetical protein [Candidatus Lokiarchaeota archaeon]